MCSAGWVTRSCYWRLSSWSRIRWTLRTIRPAWAYRSSCWWRIPFVFIRPLCLIYISSCWSKARCSRRRRWTITSVRCVCVAVRRSNWPGITRRRYVSLISIEIICWVLSRIWVLCTMAWKIRMPVISLDSMYGKRVWSFLSCWNLRRPATMCTRRNWTPRLSIRTPRVIRRIWKRRSCSVSVLAISWSWIRIRKRRSCASRIWKTFKRKSFRFPTTRWFTISPGIISPVSFIPVPCFRPPRFWSMWTWVTIRIWMRPGNWFSTWSCNIAGWRTRVSWRFIRRIVLMSIVILPVSATVRWEVRVEVLPLSVRWWSDTLSWRVIILPWISRRRSWSVPTSSTSSWRRTSCIR